MKSRKRVHRTKLKRINGDVVIKLAEQYKISVVLCRCHGQLSKKLPLEEICQFLNNAVPGIKVTVGDDLLRVAKRAIENINQLESSELAQLWSESDELADVWHADLADLLQRLQ